MVGHGLSSREVFVLRMRHRDHDISLLVALLHVRERIRDPLQGVTSIDDWLQLSSCGKLSDEIHSRHVFHGHASLESLTSLDGGPKYSTHVGQAHDVLKKHALRLQ